MPETRTLHFEQFVQAPPEDILRAFTHPTALRDWLCDIACGEGRVGSPARVGGSITLRWNDGHFVCGRYTRLDPPHGLAFTWNGYHEPGESTVEVTCSAQDGGTRVALDHRVGSGPEWDEMAESLRAHWPEMLENLQSLVETGIDLRVARRPRLGIWYDEFTAEKAAALGVPVKEGVLLEGTGENTGARAAGLLKDDVLVSLNGVALRDPSSFEQALKGLKAGDRPHVEYYRGGAKQAVALELGKFPIPELPASPDELAEQAGQTQLRTNAEMRKLFGGLIDAQAAQRPAEKEWSVKELVAHFILCERDIQSWTANMLMDNDVPDSLMFQPNVDERIGALVARLGSLKALMAELELAEGETRALLKALPEEFTVRRKHLYRRIAQWIQEVLPAHIDEEHHEQIEKAVEAAKGN